MNTIMNLLKLFRTFIYKLYLFLFLFDKIFLKQIMYRKKIMFGLVLYSTEFWKNIIRLLVKTFIYLE